MIAPAERRGQQTMEVVPMNYCRPFQVTLAILVVLTLLVTACGPTATPTPTPVLVLHPGWTSYTNANYVLAMAFDHDGNLWAGGSGGVVRWDPTDSTYTKYTVDDGLADNFIESIAVAPDGALWFGTWAGVSRFDGETWTTYTEEDGLAVNVVRSMAMAPDGVDRYWC